VTTDAAHNWAFTWNYQDEILTCPWHGLEFNIRTGQCLALPHRRLRLYPVVVTDDEVQVIL